MRPWRTLAEETELLLIPLDEVLAALALERR